MVTWMLIRVTQLDAHVVDGRPIKEEVIDLFRYRTTYTVGRGVACNLRMLSSLVSRMHGELRLLDNTVFVKDLKSSNGTYVNKHRILPDRELSLHEGDRIGFGSNAVVGPESFVFTLVKSDTFRKPVECIDLSSDEDQEPDSSQPALEAPPVTVRKDCSCSPDQTNNFSETPASRKRHMPDDCQVPHKMQPSLECLLDRVSSTSCCQAGDRLSTGPCEHTADVGLSNGELSCSRTPVLGTAVIPREVLSDYRPVSVPVCPPAVRSCVQPATDTSPPECFKTPDPTCNVHSVTVPDPPYVTENSRPAVVKVCLQSVPVSESVVKHPEPVVVSCRSHSLSDKGGVVDKEESLVSTRVTSVPQLGVTDCAESGVDVHSSNSVMNPEPVNVTDCLSSAINSSPSHTFVSSKPSSVTKENPQPGVVTCSSECVIDIKQVEVPDSSRHGMDVCSSISPKDPKPAVAMGPSEPQMDACSSHHKFDSHAADVARYSLPARESCSLQSLAHLKSSNTLKCSTSVTLCSATMPEPTEETESSQQLVIDTGSSDSETDPAKKRVAERPQVVTEARSSHSVIDPKLTDLLEYTRHARHIRSSRKETAEPVGSSFPATVIRTPSVVAAPEFPPCFVVLTKSPSVNAVQLSSATVNVDQTSCPPARVVSPPVTAVCAPPTSSSPNVEDSTPAGTTVSSLAVATSPPQTSASSYLSTTPEVFQLDDDETIEEKPVLVKLEVPTSAISDDIITISDDEAYPSSQLFEETEGNEVENADRAVLEDEPDSMDHYIFEELRGQSVTDAQACDELNVECESTKSEATFTSVAGCAQTLDEQNVESESTRTEAAFTSVTDKFEVDRDQPSTSGKADFKVMPEKAEKERRHRRKPLKTTKRVSVEDKEVKSRNQKERKEKLKSLCEKKKVRGEKTEDTPAVESEKNSVKCNKSPLKVLPMNVKVTDRNRSAMLTEAICASMDRPKGRHRTAARSKEKDVKQDVKKIIDVKNKLHCPVPVEPQPLSKKLDKHDNAAPQVKKIPKLSFKDLSKTSTSSTSPTTTFQSPLSSPVRGLCSSSTSRSFAPARVPELAPAAAAAPKQQQKPKKMVRFQEGSQLEQVRTIPALTREQRAQATRQSSRFRRDNSAPVSDIIQEICSWKTAWFRDPDLGLPPTVDPTSILPMLDFFNNHDDYRSIVERLMFCELWESVSMESKEKQSFCFIAVTNVRRVELPDRQLMDIFCYTLLQSNRYSAASQLREGHLVAVELILEKSSDVFTYSQSLSQSGSGRRFCEIIGFVMQTQQQPLTERTIPAGPLSKCMQNVDQMLSLVVRTSYRDFDLRLQDAMRLRPLCYIGPMLRAFRAVRELKTSPLCNLILHPRAEHFRRPPISERLYMQVCPADSLLRSGTLNQCQQEAVLEIAQVCRGSGQNVCLLQGPPGTGKSHVIVNLVVQLLYGSTRRMEHKMRILLCAPSNAAIDELVRRLRHVRQTLNERNKMKLVRFGVEELMHAEVRNCSVQSMARRNLDIVKQNSNYSAQCSVMDNIRTLTNDLEALNKITNLTPEDEHRRAYLVSRINTLKSSQMNSSYNRELGQVERAERLRVISCAEVVCTTIGSCCSPEMEDFARRDEAAIRYNCCIIDEATKCWEPETLMPLLLKVNNLVLVGDPAQLHGVVRSTLARRLGFEKSLFGRISSCVSKFRPNPVKFLSEQYRMLPAISHWPNKYFYGGRLQDVQGTHQRACPLKPYIVLALGYVQDVVRENSEEAEFVVQLALTVRDEVDASFSVGIITPYNQQKRAISRLLYERGRHRELSVDVIDSIQGQERDVVLVSMVRTDGVGFLSNESRLNVALTRARYSLIVCGNFTSLMGVRAWDDLLRDARERHLFLKVSEKHANSRVYLRSLVMKDNH